MRPLIPLELLRKAGERLFLDTETTGLKPPEAVLLSIAIIAELDQSITALYDVVVTPTQEEWDRRSLKAIEVNGMEYDFLVKEGVPLADAVIEFSRFMLTNKLHSFPVLIGQNPNFDIAFMQHYFPTKFLNFPPPTVLDNIELFKIVEQYDLSLHPTQAGNRPSYNTHNMSKALGVKEESVVHTAMGGAQAVRRNFIALCERMIQALDRMVDAAKKGTSEGYDVPEVRLLDKPAVPYHSAYVEIDGRTWVTHPFDNLAILA